MKSVKFIALSGTTGVTENLYVYESGNDMIIVDCGVGFPEAEMYGVDLVIPDFTYIRENKNRLRGIFITHGHEDHIGALPFLFKDVNVPIYAAKLVGGFIEDKFADYGMRTPKIHVFNPEKDSLSVGSFKVHPFRVSHSVPDSCGFAIETAEGTIFHVPDYKFDWTPVDERPFDIKRLALLTSQSHPLALASDCLGSTSTGYTQSEKEIEDRIYGLTREARSSVFFTTISSNISRMQQAINVAQKLGRQVVFVGRSIDRKAEIARKLGYLSYKDRAVISLKEAKRLPGRKLMYIISGSYGQPGSALYRAATGDHKDISIDKGDVVIFSADPAPPGSKSNVDNVVDYLIEVGADVHYYDLQEDLHVSGHGSQEDIKMLMSIVKPKYFIPIGGTVRHMRAYTTIVTGLGREAKSVFELKPGDIVEFKQGMGAVTGNIPVKEVLVDGYGIGDVGETILRDRHTLSENGVVVAVMFIKDKALVNIDLISRGFVFGERGKSLLEKASADCQKRMQKEEKGNLKNTVIKYLEDYFLDKTGRKPMVLPVIAD